MTITVNPIEYSGSVWHKFNKMVSRFINEYEGETYSYEEKSKIKDNISKDQIRFIEKDGKVIGFVNFDILGWNSEKPCEHFYRTINIMWIDPQYRHQGIASSVRKKLFAEGGKCPILGTTISVERLISNPKYWLEQGLKFQTIAPHNRNATNENLLQDPTPEKILIQCVTTIPKGGFPIGFWQPLEKILKCLEFAQ